MESTDVDRKSGRRRVSYKTASVARSFRFYRTEHLVVRGDRAALPEMRVSTHKRTFRNAALSQKPPPYSLSTFSIFFPLASSSTILSR